MEDSRYRPANGPGFVDPMTGVALEFGGDGWPKTDEEAEMMLPRASGIAQVFVKLYQVRREMGKSIREALAETLKDAAESRRNGSMERIWASRDAGIWECGNVKWQMTAEEYRKHYG